MTREGLGMTAKATGVFTHALTQLVSGYAAEGSMALHGYRLLIIRVDRVPCAFAEQSKAVPFEMLDQIPASDRHATPRRVSVLAELRRPGFPCSARGMLRSFHAAHPDLPAFLQGFAFCDDLGPLDQLPHVAGDRLRVPGGVGAYHATASCRGTEPRAPPPRPGPKKNPGDDLLSRRLSPAVPSALRGLTSLFGMGRGVSPALGSPGILNANPNHEDTDRDFIRR